VAQIVGALERAARRERRDRRQVTSVAMMRSPLCVAGASPAMSKGIVIAGINPFTGSCAIVDARESR